MAAIETKTDIKIKKSSLKNTFYMQVKLTKTDEFSSVFNFRRRLYSEYLVLNFKPNTLDIARLGLVVGKKVAKSAVSRNYMKRVLREFFRHQSEVNACDLVIHVRKKFTKNNFAVLKTQFDQQLNKLKQQLSILTAMQSDDK